MRKNHHGKKDRLVKRVFALGLALAVICTCLVPVFATEGLIDPQVNQEASRPVDDGEASYPDDEFAGFGEEEATRPVDGGEVAGFGEEEASRPVEGGEDNLDGGPNVKETEWGTVIEYDTSTSTSTDTSTSTVTQWSGEDDVVEKRDDEVVVSGDEIKKLQDMVVYRFWLKELNANDLQDITAQAQINNMTESEYLARNGEVLWNLYFIQAVPRAETIADYSSYIENPSSNRDPEGKLRLFDYWYTLDEFGNRVRLNLTDPTSNILDDKTTTVNVYAAWKDGTVGSDEEKPVDHEDLVDKNPVPVDLTTKASASYEDEDGELKTTTLPVEVKNLPSAAHSLSVIHMGYDDVGDFYEKHLGDFGSMAPILGLKISPKNAKGNTVQPAKGEKATVTVSGLDALPEMEGATADTLKVFHETSDGNVEILDVLTYTNGTLTFETTSFSPFVVVRMDGYDVETLDAKASSSNVTVMVHATKKIRASGGSYGSWSITSGNDKISLTSNAVWEKGHRYAVAYITGLATGNAEIMYKPKVGQHEYFTIEVTDTRAAIYFLSSPDGVPDSNDEKYWSPTADQSALSASIDVSSATWDKDKNIFTNVGNHILLWPDSKTTGGSWTLTSEDTSPMVGGKTAFKYVLDSIWDNYKSKIASDLDVDVNTLEKNDISQIKLKAYKISRDNSNTDGQFFHIDCMIDVVSKANFTAKFWVKYPGSEEYDLVDAKNYKHDSKVNNTEIVDKNSAGTVRVPSTMVRDGVTYQLTGWYPENTVGDPYDESKQQKLKDSWGEGYEPSKAELADGTVNFYAHYEPVSADLTISKTVTGLLGDQHRAFTFQIVDSKGNAVALTESNIQKTVDNLTEEDQAKVGLAGNGTDGKFTLVSGASITLKNLPSGEYKVIEDTVVGYDTSWKLGESGELHEKSVEATVAVQGTAQTIAFTNHATLKPDTGVLLDTLPYIVILAVVAGGVALLMLRKRRKEDD